MNYQKYKVPYQTYKHYHVSKESKASSSFTFFHGGDVCAEVDVTEGPGSNLSAQTILVADAKLHFCDCRKLSFVDL